MINFYYGKQFKKEILLKMKSSLKKINHPLLVKVSAGFQKDFVYETESFDNMPKKYYENFKLQLRKHPNYNELKDNYIFDDVTFSFVRIINKIHIDEYQDIDLELRDFYPICSKDEIKRLSDPKNSWDYLLQFRAENVMSAPRLKKVFGSLRRHFMNDWSFSGFFETSLFDDYLKNLPKKLQKKCKNVAYGTANFNEANGYVMKYPTGNVIVISSALKYSLYYFSLFFTNSNLSEESRFQSLMIAIRTMMGTEAFDFEIDERGEPPLKINQLVKDMVDVQLQFIIGHEFAHHYLDHFGDDILDFQMLNAGDFKRERKFFSYAQLDEFEADYYSVKSPQIDVYSRESLFLAAIDSFIFFDIFKVCQDYINPSSSSLKTHPSPQDRIEKLLEKFPEIYSSNKHLIDHNVSNKENLKNWLLTDFLPFNVEQFESAGSIYLEEFRKKIIYDHLDF